MEKIISCLDHLTDINLSEKQIGDEGAKLILSKNCRHIQKLYLNNNKITSLGVMGFSEAKFNNDNKLRNKGCKYISKATLPNLQKLGLRNNKIGSEGVFHLSKANWKSLKLLNLWDNKIGIDGLKRLIHCNFTKLSQITLYDNLLTGSQMLYLLLAGQSIQSLWLLDGNIIDKSNSNKLEILIQSKGAYFQ